MDMLAVATPSLIAGKVGLRISLEPSVTAWALEPEGPTSVPGRDALSCQDVVPAYDARRGGLIERVKNGELTG